MRTETNGFKTGDIRALAEEVQACGYTTNSTAGKLDRVALMLVMVYEKLEQAASGVVDGDWLKAAGFNVEGIHASIRAAEGELRVISVNQQFDAAEFWMDDDEDGDGDGVLLMHRSNGLLRETVSALCRGLGTTQQAIRVVVTRARPRIRHGRRRRRLLLPLLAK